MSDKPSILVMPRHLGPLASALEGAYTVYRFWEGPPTDVAHTIRAVVTVGEVPLERAVLDSLPALGLVAYFSAGHESFEPGWARSRGLLASHAQAVNNDDAADMGLGLIVASVRGIVTGDATVRAGEWTTGPKTLLPSLGGLRVGIVGLGAIGAALARRCEALRMQVAWWGPRDKPDAPWPRAASLIDLARDSDVLAVTSRSDAANRGLISAEVIEALGPNGLLVNIARGALVDEEALIAALKDGRLGSAALDVFATEPTDPARWREVPNTVLTPHLAGATNASAPAMFAQLKENLSAFFEGRPLATPISD